MNPFISFCLYVAARVFVQYLKSRPRDEQVRASLQFLLTAMGHLKKKNPLTESFLVQLDVDLTGSLDSPENVNKFPYSLKKGQVKTRWVGEGEGDNSRRWANMNRTSRSNCTLTACLIPSSGRIDAGIS